MRKDPLFRFLVFLVLQARLPLFEFDVSFFLNHGDCGFRVLMFFSSGYRGLLSPKFLVTVVLGYRHSGLLVIEACVS